MRLILVHQIEEQTSFPVKHAPVKVIFFREGKMLVGWIASIEHTFSTDSEQYIQAPA